MPGIEPGAFHMQSERATTALHPRTMKYAYPIRVKKYEIISTWDLNCVAAVYLSVGVNV